MDYDDYGGYGYESSDSEDGSDYVEAWEAQRPNPKRQRVMPIPVVFDIDADADVAVAVKKGDAESKRLAEQIMAEELEKRDKKETENLTVILETFPDASPKFVRTALRKYPPDNPDSVERVVDMMLSGYDKAPPVEPLVAEDRKKKDKNQRDFTKTVRSMSTSYCQASLNYLLHRYPEISMITVRSALSRTNHHLYPTLELIKKSIESPDAVDAIKIKYNKKKRAKDVWSVEMSGGDAEFLEEYAWLVEKELLEQSDKDKKLAEVLNQEQYEEAGQSIDCLCCYMAYPFEDMVQCSDGHLFCVTCLRRFAQERLFGANRIDLKCFGPDPCEANFPRTQLQKAMTEDMWVKYEDKVANAAVSSASIENLVECPFCDYKAVVENPDDKVFKCLGCGKESCRLCHEVSHIPLRCEEVEKKTETDMRLFVEQQMTEALIRECPKCKAKFFKTEGCNKMTCSCGTYVCYVCRIIIPKNVGYNHFCQHYRGMMEGKEKCEKKGCGKCILWSKDQAKQDAKAVEAKAKQAEEKFKHDHVGAADVELKVKPGGQVPQAPPPPPVRAAIVPPYVVPYNPFLQAAVFPYVRNAPAARRGGGRRGRGRW